MFLVIKYDEALKREVAINADGLTETDLEMGELFNEKTADAVASQFGGSAFSESRIFGDD